FEKEDVVLAAVEKDQAAFEQIVDESKVIAKERASSLGNDVFLDVGDHLRDLLAHGTNHHAPRGLQLRKARLDDVGLLAALEIFPALADPFLALENQICELVAEFGSKKFEQSDAEEQVNFDVLVILGLGQRALQKFAQQLAKAGVVETLDGAKLDAGEIRSARILTDQVKQIVARRLDKSRAKENIVVDIVHTDGQRSQGDRDAIAFEFDPGRFGQARGKYLVSHDFAEWAFSNVAAGVDGGNGSEGGSWRES